MVRSVRCAMAGVLAITAASGCSGSSSPVGSSGSRGGISGTITVSAAASLQETFTKIASAFEAAHPGTNVRVNFGSSGNLAAQIRNGAPADVAAFAAKSYLDQLSIQGHIEGATKIFATNRLVIVTKARNPLGITGLADLATVARHGSTISLCATTAPCGRYAAQILQAARVDLPSNRVTLGQDVRATLGAVSDGDADAGIVYATDARAVGDAVATVPIPQAENVTAAYPIGVVRSSGNLPTARAFVRFVLTPDAQRILRVAGFGRP